MPISHSCWPLSSWLCSHGKIWPEKHLVWHDYTRKPSFVFIISIIIIEVFSQNHI